MKKLSLWLLTLSWAGLTLYLTTIPNFSPASDTIYSWILSNGGHFFFFGVLAILLFVSISATSYIRYTISYSLILTSLYGLAIEFIQINIPGRSYDLKDWALDTLGAIVFLAIAKKISNQKFSNSPI